MHHAWYGSVMTAASNRQLEGEAVHYSIIASTSFRHHLGVQGYDQQQRPSAALHVEKYVLLSNLPLVTY